MVGSKVAWMTHTLHARAVALPRRIKLVPKLSATFGIDSAVFEPPAAILAGADFSFSHTRLKLIVLFNKRTQSASIKCFVRWCNLGYEVS